MLRRVFHLNMEAIIILSLLTMVASCHKLDREKYCEFLISKASDKRVQEYLNNWVRDNLTNWSKEKINPVSPYLPDYVSYNAEFDWEMIGMSENGAILLIGSHPSTEPDYFLFDYVESIYFTESSRVGIVYDVRTRGVFGFRGGDKYVNRITEKIGVMCQIHE